MSLGSDFIGGFSAVKEAKARNAKMEQDERLAQADAQLRREVVQKQIDADLLKMREGFGYTSSENAKERGWKSGEARAAELFADTQGGKQRTHQTSERLGSENFGGRQLERQQVYMGGENDKNRMQQQIQMAAENLARNRQLDAAEKDSKLRRDIWENNLKKNGDAFGQNAPGTGGAPLGATPPSTPNTAPTAPKGPGMWDRVKAGAANLGQSWRTSSPFGAGFDAAHNAERNMIKAPALPALTTMEGKIVNDPSGKRYRVINGQNVPVDQ